jgi:predicted  nucleic acid-binding Zn-ribbon protein
LARPPCPLGFDFGFDRDQEIKERSRRKSLFIRHESGVWAALPRQWALIENANKRLSEKSAEVDELRIVNATLKEEVVQAREATTKAQEDVTKAREEVAKACEDLVPLLAQARMKELEEDIAHVSDQRDVLNVQIGLVSARIGALTKEDEALKETV